MQIQVFGEPRLQRTCEQTKDKDTAMDDTLAAPSNKHNTRAHAVVEERLPKAMTQVA